jgi:hypothetical protein
VLFSLTWSADPAYGPVTSIGRGPDAADISTLATVRETSYRDESGTPSTTYAYAVRLEQGPLVGLSNVITTKTGLPAPTNVAATPLENHVRIQWGPVPGATLYRTFFETGPGRGFFGSGSAQTVDTEQVLPGERVSATVWAVDANGISGVPSTAVPGRSLPQTLFPTQTTQVDKVTYAWTFPIDADLVVIERSSDLSGSSFVELTRTAGTTFVDEAAPRWTPLLYRLRALDTVAGLSSVPIAFFAFVTEAPDLMNLGPGTEMDSFGSTLPGQSFAVRQPGQLMGIEVKNKGVGSFALSLRDGHAILASGIQIHFGSDVPAQSPLRPEGVLGNYFDLSAAGIFVSPGEKLRFELEGTEVASTTGDASLGGSLTILGAEDLARDMVFKTFVRTGSDLTAPSVVFSQGGSSAAELSWQATPGADRYEVRVSQAGAAAVLAKTTRDTTTVVDGLSPGTDATFTVRAISAGGNTIESDPVIVPIPTWNVDQANLADAFDPNPLWFVTTNAGVSFPSTQSFTAARSGQLIGIEVAPSGSSDLHIDVLDSGQQLLGTAVLPGPHPSASAEPLSPTQAGPGFVDLAALGIHVTAGQQVSLRLSSPGPVGLRSCTCAVPGAQLLDPGGSPVANRTLAFKTFVAP